MDFINGIIDFDNIIVACAVFLLGILLVVKGGDCFVDAASCIARAANIPSFIIGATIVSFATTLPEMIVSLMASVEGQNDMAVGNAIGSVTANTGLIMALAFVFMSVVAPRKGYLKQCLLLVASASVVWAGSVGGSFAPWASVLLIAFFAVSMGLNVADARKEKCENEKSNISKKTLFKNILLFIVGAAGIVLGSQCLIKGGTTVARALDVPERVIAVTMVAVGTSLPELITTLTAIRKKEAALSVGNIIGANIIDLSLILPICSFASGESFSVSADSLKFDFPACLAVTLVAVLPMMIKQRGYKLQGILMIALYAAYLVVTV